MTIQYKATLLWDIYCILNLSSLEKNIQNERRKLELGLYFQVTGIEGTILSILFCLMDKTVT